MLYLSWLPAWNTPFDPDAHAREDEFCIRGSIYEQEEGDIIVSGFEVEIPNPGLALLNVGRTERYAVLSEKLASDNMPVELARGRVIAVPSELGQQTLTLRFQCVPPDEDEVLKSAADALRTGEVDDYDPNADVEDRDAAESYDALFHSRDASDDPTSALAGRLELWRWNRKTLEIERTSMIHGDITHDVHHHGFEDTLSVSLRNPPRKTTRMRVVASWTQEAKGVQTYPTVDHNVQTFSWQDLIQSLPQPGTPVGENTGWHVAESAITNFTPGAFYDTFDVDPAKYALNDDKVSTCQLLLQPARVGVQIRLGYDFEQQREEHLTIHMPVAQQDVLGDDKVETVDVVHLAPLNIDPSTRIWDMFDPVTGDMAAYEVGDERIYNGKKYRCIVAHTAMPFMHDFWQQVPRKAAINPAAARYFDTDRGIRSTRYAIRMLQRRVYVRARCLEISFQCDWQTAREMTCRDACRIENRKLGEVTAKISSIKLVADGAKRYAEVTLLACLGDGSEPPVAGGGTDEMTSDVVYSVTSTSPSTPTVASQLATRAHWVDILNDYSDQWMAAVGAPDPVEVIENMPTRLEIFVNSIREEDLLTRQLTATCQPVWLPQNALIGS